MKILALEFSSPQRSVAVREKGTAYEALDSAPGRTMKPLSMVKDVLRQVGWEREQVECIAIGLGPGSYTGIRAAIALAQGWQLGQDVKLLGVSSVEAIAAQAQADGLRGRVNVVIDAQRGELYRAGYELEVASREVVVPLRIVGPDAITAAAGELIIGPEVTKWFPQGRLIYPRAAILANLALRRSDFVSGEKLEPIYLRETTFVKAPPPRVIPGL